MTTATEGLARSSSRQSVRNGGTRTWGQSGPSKGRPVVASAHCSSTCAEVGSGSIPRARVRESASRVGAMAANVRSTGCAFNAHQMR